MNNNSMVSYLLLGQIWRESLQLPRHILEVTTWRSSQRRGQTITVYDTIEKSIVMIFVIGDDMDKPRRRQILLKFEQDCLSLGINPEADNHNLDLWRNILVSAYE